MKNNHIKINKDILREYILGRLNEKDSEKLEMLYFENDEIFGELLITEEELIESYNKNELSVEETKNFIKNYLNTPDKKMRVRLDKLLTERIQEIKREHHSPNPLLKGVKSFIYWLSNLLYRPSIRYAAIGVAVVIIAAIFLRQWLFLPSQKPFFTDEDIIFAYQSSGITNQRNARKLTDRIVSLRDYDTSLVLTNQDSYAFIVQPKSDIFLYLFQTDTTGNITVIFPNQEFSNFTNPLSEGKMYKFQQNDENYFILDTVTGREIIMIGASINKWQDLEENINLLNKSKREEKLKIIANIKSIIEEYEINTDEEYYGKQFSFIHSKK